MPLYDFQCRSCKTIFESLVMGSAPPRCPRCGSEDLEKLISSFACRRGGKKDGSGGSPCAGCAGGNCATCR